MTTDSFAPKYAPLEKFTTEGAGFVNPRPVLPKDDIRFLADDIAERSLQTPIKVWDEDEHGAPVTDEAGRLIIISGKQRHAAISLLVATGRANGYAKATPYHSFKGSLNDARIEALVENMQRRDLTTFATAAALQILVEGGVQQKVLAKRVKKSTAWVSRNLNAYRDSIQSVKDAWEAGKITIEGAQLIAGLKLKNGEPDADAQEKSLAAHIKAQASGSKAERIKVRAESKKKVGKKKVSVKSHARGKDDDDDGGDDDRVMMASYRGDLDGVKRDQGYLHGLHDGLRLALGEIGDGELAKPFKEYMKALNKERAAAKAEASDKDE